MSFYVGYDLYSSSYKPLFVCVGGFIIKRRFDWFINWHKSI